MSGQQMAYAHEAFAFVDSLDEVETVDGVIEALTGSLSLFGFENFIIVGLPNPDERFEDMVVLKKWPTGWFELYAKEDYCRVDPVIRMCRNTVNPFEWSEAPYDPLKEAKAHELMNRAGDFRMPRGFSLPIHGLNGYETCFSMSGVDLDLTGRTRPAIHLMALYAYERVRQIARPAESHNPLTAREREVLTWAAAGKSANETADILSITERTVRAHLERSCDKLGAASKTHAVARAMKYRLITV
jgi:LuxR family transcriptional regulator, quorum-sensing system regulator BjaR1